MTEQITFQYENVDLKEKEVKAIYIGQPDGAAKKYVPEKHGKWEIINDDCCVCSECHKASVQDYYFCPECGASMDGESE